jgi:MFS family permease
MSVAAAPSPPQASRAERLLVPATFITSLGNSIQLTASAVLIVQTERTTLAVGWLFIAVAVPQVLLSLYFGRLSDRFDRRVLSIVADVLSAAAALALPVWLLLGGSAKFGAYVAGFVLAALAALFTPASGALVKERVPAERLGPFNANFEIATQAGTLLSAAAGGFVIQIFGVKPLFAFNAITFIASATLLYAIGQRQAAGVTPPSPTHDDALDACFAAPDDSAATDLAPSPGGHPVATLHLPIARLGLLYALGNIVITLSNALLVVLVLQAFQRGAGVLGLVDALAGIGIMLAAAAYKRVSLRISNLRIALLGYLACSAVIALEPFHVAILMVLIPFAGMTFGLARVAARTMLMRAVEESRAGRVFGATQAVGLGLGATFTVALATLADHTSIRIAFFGLALVVAVGTATTVASLRGSIDTRL